MSQEELTYEELAAHYDRIYHDKPYLQEAQRVVDLLRKQGAREGQRLLDIGCGTGQHVQHFVDTFEVTGIDVHEAMLEIARERVPEARFEVGDVTSLELGERFDALTCLFGVLGYVETWENLEASVATVADHLEPGAPFVVESWITPESFHELPTLRTFDDPEDCTLARIAMAKREDESTARLDIEWMIAWPGGEIQRYTETQHMGIFDVDRTVELFDEHGLEVEVDRDGLTDTRVLYVGNKRA